MFLILVYSENFPHKADRFKYLCTVKPHCLTMDIFLIILKTSDNDSVKNYCLRNHLQLRNISR